MTLADLKRICPQLNELLRDAAEFHGTTESQAKWSAYGGLKARLTKIVGFAATGAPSVRTSLAYDLAVRAIAEAMNL